MKAGKLTLAKVQDQGVNLAGGISGAITQGAVSALAKKYAPSQLTQFIDPLTIVAGVVLSTMYSKNAFLESAGFGMAFKPGWSIVRDQLQSFAPQGGGDGFVDTAVKGAVGMGNPTPSARTIPVGMLRNRQRNDVISIPKGSQSRGQLDLSAA